MIASKRKTLQVLQHMCDLKDLKIQLIHTAQLHDSVLSINCLVQFINRQCAIL